MTQPARHEIATRKILLQVPGMEAVTCRISTFTSAGANSPWAPVWAPPTIPPNGRVSVQATFWQPGAYVLRARADDGALPETGSSPSP